MRCANCGNELKAGSLYCDVCGHPVQIVPDYNEFDDYLDNLVGNDDRRTDGQKTVKPVSDRTIRFDEPVREQLHSAGQRNGQKPDRMSQYENKQAQTGKQQSQTKQPCDEKPQSDGQRAKRAQQKKIIIISAVVCAVAIVILIAAITRNVSRSHDNSFDYQVRQAKAAYSAGNINSAVSYYEKLCRLIRIIQMSDLLWLIYICRRRIMMPLLCCIRKLSILIQRAKRLISSLSRFMNQKRIMMQLLRCVRVLRIHLF